MIINWVSLVILFSIVAFVLLLTGTILFFNSLIMSLTAITFNRMFGQAFHIARRSCIPVCKPGTILHFNYFVIIIAITISAYLVKSFISCPKTNACTVAVDISVFDHCDLLEEANHLSDDCKV